MDGLRRQPFERKTLYLRCLRAPGSAGPAPGEEPEEAKCSSPPLLQDEKQKVQAGENAAVQGWTSNRGISLGFENSGKAMNATGIPKLKQNRSVSKPISTGRLGSTARSAAVEFQADSMTSLAPVTLVLAEDGTIVDDDDYFLCLPSNTKFVALAGNEKWAYSNSDGGTAWITQESFDGDETDSGAGMKWKNVARQLKEDLSSIILLSEEDLQMLIDVPCSELAQELCQSQVTVQGLQNTLQQVLDQREEARQSKQLLELYLQALEKEGSVLSKQQESRAGFADERDAVDTGIRESSSEIALSSRILTTLREKAAPELSLSSEALEVGKHQGP
ncbi:DNA fragmentation factor subunit alpha-like protein [Camelus ferus]|nr:DNA fragmentation factor subunit alpha-like protein [Camelus ferus]